MQATEAEAVMVLGPELTVAHAAPCRAGLLARLDAAANAWPGVDLGGVEAIDSAGVQLLLALHRELAERGQPWQVTAASPAVHEVLRLYGLQHLLPDACEPELP